MKSALQGEIVRKYFGNGSAMQKYFLVKMDILINDELTCRNGYIFF